jgi:hypothetical protein
LTRHKVQEQKRALPGAMGENEEREINKHHSDSLFIKFYILYTSITSCITQ